MNDSAANISTYKEIVDQLVRETRSGSIYSRRAVENAPFSPASEQSAFNQLLSSLTGEQRALLSEVLMRERDSAIHDVLAVLSWWIDCRGIGLSVNGERMPVDLSGMGLHGDYAGRAGGWEWPGDEG